ncbi:MFS transporter [Microbacterium sp. X-17]|uniref:MFS transporter n=1 Tax=Microbacterium sp. X-17 TaxID=3144404 RepID=UPI0031F58681
MTSIARPRTSVHKTAILAIILISFFMVILDNSIIFTGLPAIRDEMQFSAAGLAWVQDAYTLTFGGLLLLAARAGDILGRRRLFIVGLVIFTIASVLVAVAMDPAFMIAARALQGIGSAIVAPTSLSLLMATFDEGPERSRAVMLYAAVAGIGASLGLILGGAFAELISWRAGFLLNVPIGIVMIVLTARFVPEANRIKGRFDIAGAVLSTLGMSALIFGIVESALSGWAAPTTIVPIVAGILLLGGFVVNEWRAPQPIMPLRLFASAVRSSAYAIRLLYMGAFIGFFFFLTQYLQEVLGWNALEAGLGFLPMTVVNFAVAMAVTAVVNRIGLFTTLGIGVLLTLVGMAWLSFVHADSSFFVDLAIPMMFVGAGQGLALAPMTDYGLQGVRTEDAGAASGMTNTAQQLGLSIGLAVLVALTAGVSGGDRVTQLVGTVNLGLAGAAGMLVIALVLVVAVILPSELIARRRRGNEPETAQPSETVVVAH